MSRTGPTLNFPDRGEVDDDLWRNVRALAHYRVALGYEDGTYNPTGEVSHQQVILFIARALVVKGYWIEQPDTNPYPNLPNATDRERADRRAIATYVHYAGAVPDRPTGQAWADWDQPATRGWFAQVLWQALQTLPSASPSPVGARLAFSTIGVCEPGDRENILPGRTIHANECPRKVLDRGIAASIRRACPPISLSSVQTMRP